jgi:hypothetical protein
MAFTVGGADEAGLLELEVAPEEEEPLLDGPFCCWWLAARFLAEPPMMTVVSGSDGCSVDSSVKWSRKSEATQVGRGGICDALVILWWSGDDEVLVVEGLDVVVR